ncbi:hypothetical protein NQ315_013772 [Exocentrus adspersus]|uniref:Uncharacterized protein n=1 Tax=Exocentrus adspersus TaxID=1586481 RepID=A0AAV8W458_9CUCU|nr:hypothetical protein NQ315_013772 [Exocentrus adspersus]
MLWGVVKSDVYHVPAATREDMVERIQQSFQRISPLVLSNNDKKSLRHSHDNIVRHLGDLVEKNIPTGIYMNANNNFNKEEKQWDPFPGKKKTETSSPVRRDEKNVFYIRAAIANNPKSDLIFSDLECQITEIETDVKNGKK